jgi:hypothetical protein
LLIEIAGTEENCRFGCEQRTEKLGRIDFCLQVVMMVVTEQRLREKMELR